jgi:hypothetical protein
LIAVGEEHDDGERDENDCDRLELATQICRGPSWIALAISFIFGVPSSCAMTFLASMTPERADGDESCNCGQYEHCPLAASQEEVLVAAFGSNQ